MCNKKHSLILLSFNLVVLFSFNSLVVAQELSQSESFHLRLDKALSTETSLLPLIEEMTARPLAGSEKQLQKALIEKELNLYPQHSERIQMLEAQEKSLPATRDLHERSTHTASEESWIQRNGTGLFWSSLLLVALASTKYEIEFAAP